ncbi:MAG: O-antigen ligase family protein [Geminicoccaceae bacterium]|nr:O-antigen ligase family protein [Geminicoccaceae bacterium]MCX8101746.1 O-antigen ligase family protein [Geminicoccaceae bacterium]MDW8369584.1 O-antigen ligase family protein [Geminicoccaceae bacterium]
MRNPALASRVLLPGHPAQSFARAASEAFLAYALVISTGAVLPLLAMGSSDALSAEDSALLRLALLPLLVVTPLLALAHGRAILGALLDTPLLPLLVLLVAASTIWSVLPAISARRALAFATFSLLAVILAVRWSPRELVERLLWLALVVVAVSLAFQLALPDLSRMSDGAWRGAFTHKNGLGHVSSFAIVILLVGWRHRLAPRALVALGLLAAVLLLIASRSATSLVVTALAAGLFLLLGRGGLPPAAKAALVSLAVAALALLGLWVLLEPEAAVALLGRDLTFTGRLPLWEHVLARIAERPWTGWGYQAYWAVPAFADYVMLTLGWPAPNAHSGYLDVALGLGWPGLLLALLLLAQALVRALRTLASGDRVLGETALLLVVALLVRNLSESELLQQSGLLWLLLATLLLRTRPVPRS